MKKIIFLFASLLISLHGFGTHIIGGNFTYTYLSGNSYQITFVIYRDCYNGIPPFDDPAPIGIFDVWGNLYQTLHVPVFDSSDVFIQGNCIPGNVCIVRAIYTDIVTLPPTGGPYTFTYQRCCRSITVGNLVDPGNNGMSIFGTIDPADQNNSAIFNHEMAAFTYVGDNFSFDGSSVDPDGDLLFYSLDDAHEGASQLTPIGDPPSAPPYSSLLWQSPYSASNMLGGTLPLSIDPVTGLMTAQPGTMGVFVVSQKVDEYRNGNLINTVRREFVIAVNPAQYFDLSGTVSADNGTQNLDVGKAWLIRKNLLDGTLTAVDTNQIASGSYLHSQAINGVYLVKASADSVSPFYASNIPTYFGDELFWYNATPVTLCYIGSSGININLLQGINPGGPGFVGGLISQGANRTSTVAPNLGGITVILYDQQYQPVAYAITDTNGVFGISNLAPGNYKVFIDRLNFNVDNNLAPTINVNASNPVTNNLTFLLHDTWLEYTGAVGQEEITENQAKLMVYPNPVTSELTLNNTNIIPVGTEYAIFNVFGEEMVKGKLNSYRINVESLSPQVYILRIATVNKIEYLKFVRK